jgi:hypothetical protein
LTEFVRESREKTLASYDRMRIMTLVRRWLLLWALMFWQGGFTFYGGVVVPVGSDVLGSEREQGFITRSVTNYLNLAGTVALAVWGWDLTAMRGTSPGSAGRSGPGSCSRSSCWSGCTRGSTNCWSRRTLWSSIGTASDTFMSAISSSARSSGPVPPAHGVDHLGVAGRRCQPCF